MRCVSSSLCVLALAAAACGSPRSAPLADAGASDAGTLAVDLELLAGDIHGRGTADGTGAAAHFNTPFGIAADAAGTVYVADTDNFTIRKITAGGVVTTLAGAAGQDGGSTDGVGAAARFLTPSGVAVDATGNVYVADQNNHTIREVSPAGAVTTLAGAAGQTGSLDDTGAAARFHSPSSVAVDGAGNVYVADRGNDTIRKITADGVVSTLAGTAGAPGSANGTGTAARFDLPSGVAVDAAGNVYVADEANNTIRKITPDGVVTTLAGTPGPAGSSDGTGSAARFNQPTGVAVDTAGNVYVTDETNNTIRKITPDGVVTTLAGLAGQFGSTDGTGSAARFDLPTAVAADGAGNLYVADTSSSTIRKVTPAGTVTTLAGTAPQSGGADGTGAAARFSAPGGIAIDSAGNIAVADLGNDTIRVITPAGVVTTLAGAARQFGSIDGTGAAARFDAPSGVAVDGAGKLYIADKVNDTIRVVTPAGVVTTLAGKANAAGNADGPAGRFFFPSSTAIDGAGNVYVADTLNSTIRKVTPDGVVSTLAGLAGVPGSVDGIGAATRFNFPEGIAVDGAGNVYVADTGNDTIRMIAPGGAVTTLAGAPGVAGSADGASIAARFHAPTSLALDATGNLYVTDTGNSTLRKVTPSGLTTTIAGTPGVAGIVLGTAPRLASPQGVAIAGDALLLSDANAILQLHITGR